MLAVVSLVCSMSFADAYKVLTFPDGNNEAVSSYIKTWTATVGDFTWTIANFNNNSNKWAYIKCGRKDNESVAYIDTETLMDKSIGSVVVTIDAITSSKINSISLTVASDKEFANVIETIEAETLDKGEMQFDIKNPTPDSYYRLTFDCASGTGNGLVQVSKVSYYEPGNDPIIVDITNTPETAYTVAKAKELIAAGDGLATNVYVKGKISAITEISTSYGNATYNISDDGTATGELVVFRGYSLNGDKFTSEDEINVGDEVVLYGQLVSYNGTDQLSGSIIYSLNGGSGEVVDISNTPETAYTVTEANELITAGKGLATSVYVKGKISAVTEISLDFGNATYTIYDNDTDKATDELVELVIFRGYSLEGNKFTSEDEINVGDEVIVYGKLVNYNGTYEMTTGSSIYSLNGRTTSGISTVKADAQVDGVVYNMAGQRLAKPAKGINIIGGRKVIVK